MSFRLYLLSFNLGLDGFIIYLTLGGIDLDTVGGWEGVEPDHHGQTECMIWNRVLILGAEQG